MFWVYGCVYWLGERRTDGDLWFIMYWRVFLVNSLVSVLSNISSYSVFTSLHFILNTSTLFFFQEADISFSPLTFGFIFSGNFPIVLLLDHLPLKMTRRIVPGSPKRKSPEAVSCLFPRNPNRRGRHGWRRTPYRPKMAQKVWLLRKSW